MTLRPRPHEIWTLIVRDRRTGSVFPDSYVRLDDACEAYDDLDGAIYEIMGACHTQMHHPAAPGDTEQFDIEAATSQWRRDREMERRHRDQERAGLYRHLAAE